MDWIYKHIICFVITFCGLPSSALTQETLLEQYAFTSTEDSILLFDYVDPEYNYLFILYGSWCNNCIQELEEYEAYYSDWLHIYNTKVVVLDDFTFDNIEDGLVALEAYPYEAFATERIRVSLDLFDFPSNFLFGQDREQIVLKTGFTSALEMNDLITLFIPKNPSPVLRGPIDQLVTYYDECEALNTERITTNNNPVEINGQQYLRFTTTHGETHYVRESDDETKLFYLDTLNNEEYLLFDYDVSICDTVNIYSVSEQRLIEAHVLDIYCEFEYFYYELDIPFSNCFEEQKYFTMIAGVGSNAGLFAEFNETSVNSLLRCQKLNEKIIFEDIFFGDCQVIVANEDLSESNPVTLSPNPATDYVEMNHNYNHLEIISITDINAKEIVFKSILDNQLDVKDVPVGLYVINYIADGKYGSVRFLKI